MTLINKKTWTVLFVPLSLLTIISFSSIVNSAEIIEPPQYGAPYYNTSRYSYSGHPGNTVSEAIDNWWAAYKAYWGVMNCSYDLTLYDDGYTSGYFANMRVKNGCHGRKGVKSAFGSSPLNKYLEHLTGLHPCQ